ncbi:MAG: phosphohistidine phosphatase SixA [Armatimonadota bacterium]
MRVYLLRHGIAEDPRIGLSDRDRQLTAEGIEELHAVARGLRRLELKLDLIVTSPFARARRTAEIVASGLSLDSSLREDPRLASGEGVEPLLDLLQRLPGNARVMLVGHEPTLSEAVSTLIGGGAVRMKKASLACVELNPRFGAGELRWLLEAKQMAALAGD